MDVFRDYSSLTFIGLPHTFFYVGSMKRPFLIKGRTYVFINSVDGLLRHQINRPKHQDSSYCFNQEVGSKHLEPALIIPVKAIRGKRPLSTGREKTLEIKTLVQWGLISPAL
jgi:hypothetical protein